MKSAVIQTGGKQYLVSEDTEVAVDRLPNKEGENITFDSVLLTASDKAINVGTPLVKGAKVEGKIIRQARHNKVVGVKMKSKKRYRRYFGHKQPYTAVKIIKIATR